MARPAQVEFPGQKRQRMRMRGTKQANLDTQKRLRKNLDTLLEEGETLLPAMTWTGKLKWGRTCLLYTSDAADDMQCVDLGGRRII